MEKLSNVFGSDVAVWQIRTKLLIEKLINKYFRSTNWLLALIVGCGVQLQIFSFHEN